MRFGGIEIHAVAGVEQVLFAFEAQREGAFENEEEFGAIMKVFLHVSSLAEGKLGNVGLEAFSLRPEGETLEKVGGLRSVGTVRKAQAFGASHEGEGLLAAAVAEEVIETNVEDHGNPRQRRERGKEMSIFELGEHRGGKAGVLAEIDEGNLLAKAELPELASNLISGEYTRDRFLATFGGLRFHISYTEIIIFYFSHT